MTTFFDMLFSWANAPYTIALLVVFIYVAIQSLGFLPWGEHGDANADAGADGEADLHADTNVTDHALPGHLAHDVDYAVDHDIDHDLNHDVDADAHPHADVDSHGDSHVEAGHSPSITGMLSSALGVGKVPLSIIWQTLFTFFALTGIISTTIIFAFTGRARPAYLALTLPIAVVVGTVLSAGLVRGIARLVPSTSGEASRRRDLVGCLGVVISSKITDEFGEIRLQSPQGATLRLICRTKLGDPPLLEGSQVVVVDYERERDLLYVSGLTNYLEGKS